MSFEADPAFKTVLWRKLGAQKSSLLRSNDQRLAFVWPFFDFGDDEGEEPR